MLGVKRCLEAMFNYLGTSAMSKSGGGSLKPWLLPLSFWDITFNDNSI